MTRTLPVTALPERAALVRFRWSYEDETFSAQGEGAVRTQAPERARVDLFLADGSAAGNAILVGDTLDLPGGVVAQRVLPPAPILWAALGVLRLPGTRDTVVTMARDTIDADVTSGANAGAAREDHWRVRFVADRLIDVWRIEGRRSTESVHREPTAAGLWAIRYVQERARMRLRMTVTDTLTVEPFDETIWRRR